MNYALKNHLANSTYTPMTIAKEDILDIHMLVLRPLEFQAKINNWIYRHPTWFLDYTSVLTNSIALQGLPNAPRNIFPNH
jgi:hypothetical protein